MKSEKCGVAMLTQQEADTLIQMLKRIQNTQTPFEFPVPGGYRKIDLISEDGKQAFVIDINRKGNLNLAKKCTYQGRFLRDIILLRLDINGPEHTNPDGKIISGNHMHLYQEEYGDRYAIELPQEIKNSNDLIETLIDFLSYFKACNIKNLEIQEVI